MHVRFLKLLYMALGLSLFWIPAAGAADKTLALVDSSGSATINVVEGDPIAVDILIDDAAGVAGASFSVLYDSRNLALRPENPITSDFFQTFVQQGLLTPPDDPEFITVAEQDYYGPILSSPLYPDFGPVPLGIRLAAARADNGSGINVVLLTLHFVLTGPPGEYPISIIQSTIRNGRAGYRRSGELIPLLMGYSGDTDYQFHRVSTLIPGTIVIKPPFIDSDGDGIDDNWELAHVPPGTKGNPLDVFSYNGDFDHDGYTDYQEYLNDLNGESDPAGNRYNPTQRNAPGGSEYVPRGTNALPAINLLLLGR